MHPEILAIMRRQHGLVTRRQLLQLGVTPWQIKHALRAREWTVIRRGVYAETSFVLTQRSVRERRLLIDRAASLRVVMPHVMSHDSAAYELDMSILQPSHPMTHLTRAGVVGSHLVHGVKHHLAPYRSEQVVEVNRRRVLGRARTAIDIAREHGNPAGVVAVDDARRNGVGVGELEAVLEGMVSWSYVTEARDAVARSDPDADGPGETLARELVTELGHGRPQSQFGLTRDGRTAWADLRLGRHLIEFDGKVKYRRVEDGGLAVVAPEEVVWHEKQREDWLRGFNLGMSRLVWDDHFGDARARALGRVEREYLETCRLFGTSIDDLTPFLARGPRRRPGHRAA